MNILSQRFALAFFALAMCGPKPARAQQDFPNRRINVVVPYPAGGIVDNTTRIITDKLSTLWAQTIIVDVRPGGDSNIGTDFAYPAVNVVPWYGFAVPRETPRSIVDRIAAGIGEALRDPDVKRKLEQQALQPVEPMTTAEIADLIEKDTRKYATIIRDANIKLND